MKAYVGADVEIHIFLTMKVVGGEWSVSRPCRFTPGDGALGTHCGPQSRSGRFGELAIVDPTGT
jgi:hypothetical protein